MKQGKHNLQHEAQPDNLPKESAARLLRTAASVLEAEAEFLLSERPTKLKREIMRRILAGAVADIENVRYSLKD